MHKTITEAAKQKGCSRQCMHNLVKAGKVNCMSVEGKNFVIIDDKFHNAKIGKDKASRKGINELEREVVKLRATVAQLTARLEKLEETVKAGILKTPEELPRDEPRQYSDSTVKPKKARRSAKERREKFYDDAGIV